jgi:hypothetical protein
MRYLKPEELPAGEYRDVIMESIRRGHAILDLMKLEGTTQTFDSTTVMFVGLSDIIVELRKRGQP